MSAEHGPQFGLVKSSTAGRPVSRNVPSEAGSPDRLCAAKAGARSSGSEPELRHRLVVELVAGARERGLDAVEAREHLAVGPHEGEEGRTADDEDAERDCGDDQREQLGALEVTEPCDRARLVVD